MFCEPAGEPETIRVGCKVKGREKFKLAVIAVCDFQL